MAIDYPQILGGFLQEGYAYQLNPGIRRTQLSSGNAIQRRKANQRTRVSVTQKLTVDQMAVFEIFILKSAWDWFNANIETGEGYRQVECRILEGSITSQLIGKVQDGKSFYQVGLTLELKNTNAVAEDADLTAEYMEALYTHGLTEVQQAATVNPLSVLVGV
ncbi:hypothetical protein [Thiomicrorhabdus lithotrophica]|uniref:Uncharacterized protein n=1 Tax=Thiomicrorhabdus lithotrophica TaxID=2949997 RepID=A0ABY8CA88_9GAMM|nr:hypothetical protein [Thiomicrorhabdus lithotrophica]WEJ62147.1 hypothetical protein NR989_09015 [Thiomicrorhabdus lithotrophica]